MTGAAKGYGHGVGGCVVSGPAWTAAASRRLTMPQTPRGTGPETQRTTPICRSVHTLHHAAELVCLVWTCRHDGDSVRQLPNDGVPGQVWMVAAMRAVTGERAFQVGRDVSWLGWAAAFAFLGRCNRHGGWQTYFKLRQ